MAAMFACKLPLSVDVHSSVNAQAKACLGVCTVVGLALVFVRLCVWQSSYFIDVNSLEGG